MKTKTKSLLYSNAKPATLKEIRALKIGDVIECYYPDSETPRLEIVQATWCVSKRGDAGDLMTILVSHLGLRNNDNVSALNNLRTDKFKKVGHIEIVFDQTLDLKAPASLVPKDDGAAWKDVRQNGAKSDMPRGWFQSKPEQK